MFLHRVKMNWKKPPDDDPDDPASCSGTDRSGKRFCEAPLNGYPFSRSAWEC